MRIEAENASRWVPSLKVDYRLRMPVNKIAAVQTGIDVMERAQRSGLPISPEWVMEEMMGIEQPWEEFKRAITWRNLLSPAVMEAMNRHWLQEAEVDLGGDEGLTVQEFMEGYVNIPPDLKRLMVEHATGGGGGMGPEGRGAGVAGAPFSRRPGGPQPMMEQP